jgi:hypothetical protein
MHGTSYITYIDVPNINGTAGVDQNKVIEVLDFLDKDTCNSLINYIDANSERWNHFASYEYRLGKSPKPDLSFELFGLPSDFIGRLVKDIKQMTSSVFLKEISLNTIHAQRFGKGGSGSVHSDNTNEDGSDSHYEINKYAAIIYLNDQYSGGEIYFPEHDLSIKPRAGSMLLFPGGKENLHGVNEIVSGYRHTIISFWDFAESKYSEERELWRADSMKKWSDSWQVEWEKEWKSRWALLNFID